MHLKAVPYLKVKKADGVLATVVALAGLVGKYELGLVTPAGAEEPELAGGADPDSRHTSILVYLCRLLRALQLEAIHSDWRGSLRGGFLCTLERRLVLLYRPLSQPKDLGLTRAYTATKSTVCVTNCRCWIVESTQKIKR